MAQGEFKIFLAPDPAAGQAGDRVACDLSVPVDVERPAGGADVRQCRRCRSRWRSSPQMRQFSVQIELTLPATFISLIVPLAVFFIFQRSVRPGTARRVGQVIGAVAAGLRWVAC